MTMREDSPAQPKILVLDGYVANPGDLSWTELETLGQLTVFDRTEPQDVAERLRGSAIAVTNKTLLPRQVFAACPELRFVSVLATGTNVVDLQAASDHGVLVSNVPAYSTASTAQHTIALLLELAAHVGAHSAGVHAGRWTEARDFSYWDSPLVELDGLTLGVVGFGAIGQRVATIAQALGMKVLVHSRTERDFPNVRFVDKQTLLRESDVVSLHCPLTPDTHHFIDGAALSLMKPSAFLLNASRGPVVDDQALASALNGDRIAGAALDVLREEPPPATCPLLGAKNCVITPHIAWATRAARARLLKQTVENVRAFLAGTPINVCRP
jgi:glycerate dehydrogenase